ncbi:processed acidic surface protein [Pueribacillus theae]|uniref:processed acidic surface protein n=1 Tax=Pueribacillus theae TaxID=2171751 RepID=UPI0014036546|nr:processed acidic surface protein [Pueribacillus theae]
MKKPLAFVLALSFVCCLFPFQAFAKVEVKDKELQAYLKEIGMPESEFVEYLKDVHDYSLEDFDDVDDLKEYLGEVLNDENLQSLLDEYGLSREELDDLLAEIGASVDDYVFYDDLDYDVSDLLYDEELTPINDETLKDVLSEYGFKSRNELENYLNKNGDSINNYESLEDLDLAIFEYQMEDEISEMLKPFGLTKDEIKNLKNHFMAIFEKNIESENEEFFNRMESIGERMMGFADFESAEELSAKEIAELLSIWNEMLDLFELKTEFYLVKNGKEMPISLNQLMKLESTDGANLLIKFFSKSGKFLADMVITKEMFGSDLLEQAGSSIVKTKKTAKEAPKAVKKPSQKVKTVNGAKLPKTASDYLPNTFAGLAILLSGLVLFRKMKSGGAM